MIRIPLRVDIAGGWLDVPRLAIPGAFIVNVAISPLVELCVQVDKNLDPIPNREWMYWVGHPTKKVPKGSGLGTSAAWHILHGRNVLAEELAKGCGWQDPAVIAETGLCVWASGPEPVLVSKESGAWLRGCLALHWTGHSHVTADIVSFKRNYVAIANAADCAMRSLRTGAILQLADAIEMGYRQQLAEGMEELPAYGLASKYCGAGHGGYAMYLFEGVEQRDAAVAQKGMMAVEPYCK